MTRYSVCSYGLYVCFTAFMTYYGLSGEGLAILSVLMLVDVIFGIAKSYVLKGDSKERFSSNKLKVGVLAKVVVLILIMVLAAALGFLTRVNQVTFLLIDAIVGVLIAAELISVIQNALMIKQRRYIPERDAVSAVLNRILGIVKKFIEGKVTH